jgi:hypothetical protein
MQFCSGINENRMNYGFQRLTWTAMENICQKWFETLS